jgi:hypothetical protein
MLSFSKKSLLFVVPGLGFGALMAAGLVDPWISPKDNKIYVDAKYLGGSAEIEVVKSSGSGSGSGSEELQLKVLLPKGTGSLTEDAYYVGSVEKGASLPTEVALFPADSDYEPTSDEEEGTLNATTFDKTSISGKLFTYKLQSLPVEKK